MKSLLSAAGMSAPEIAELLHYDPVTVRRWITRHTREGIDGLPDKPRGGRPRLGSPRLGQRIRTLLQTPKAWTTSRVWRAAERPDMSLRTFYRRLREQARWCRPRLIAKGDPDHDSICARIRTVHGAVNLATGAWHHHISVKNGHRPPTRGGISVSPPA